jgi:hypothetical protein
MLNARLIDRAATLRGGSAPTLSVGATAAIPLALETAPQETPAERAAREKAEDLQFVEDELKRYEEGPVPTAEQICQGVDLLRFWDVSATLQIACKNTHLFLQPS